MIGNGAVALYWGRNGRVLCCISLLGTMLKGIPVCISTGDGVVEYSAVYLYWRQFGRLPHFRSLLGTVW